MNRRFLKNLIAAAILLLTISCQGYAQTDTLIVIPDVFYDELNGLKDVFADTTNTDTLKFTQNGVIDIDDFWGYEILNSGQLTDLISTHELTIDNGTNNILFEDEDVFTDNGESYKKYFSYSVNRKNFNHVSIDNVLYSDIYCLHILEKLKIDKVDFPSLLEIDNNYYVLYDDQDNLVAIIAYNENFSDRSVYTQKYFEIPTGSKSLATNRYVLDSHEDYLGITPNPASSNVVFNVMMKQPDNAKITISDIAGKKIDEMDVLVSSKGNNVFPKDLSRLSPGVYIVTLTSSTTNKTAKLVISK